MKIQNSYWLVRKGGAFLKPTKELNQHKLLVTGLDDPNLSDEIVYRIDREKITLLCFSCSIADFNQLPSDILVSCKKLIKEYPNADIVFSAHQQGYASHPICHPAYYLDLLINSRANSLDGSDAKICFNFIKSIYLMRSSSSNVAKTYMPQEVCDNIIGVIHPYIKNNGHSKFVDKFKEYFKPEDAYSVAVLGSGFSFLFLALCVYALPRACAIDRDGDSYLSSVLGVVILLTANMWIASIYPEFSIKNGKVDFENKGRRVDLINLYKDIGGRLDYQLWDGDIPDGDIPSKSLSFRP